MRRALRWLGTLLGLAMLGWLVAHLDLGGLSRALAHAGPFVLLLAAPFFGSMALDALAWRRLLSLAGHDARFRDLLPLRVIAEAFVLSLPGGAGVAESVLPKLVEARTGVPALSALASSVAKRWTVMRARALYVLLAGALGFGMLAARGRDLAGTSALPWLVLSSAHVPLTASLAVQATFAGGLLGRVLGRFGLEKSSLDGADAALALLARSRDLVPTALELGSWLCESVEAWIILRLVGAHPSFAEVLTLEAGLSVVRALAFFAPAGLGVQDLGYLRGFEAFGFGEHAGAFVVLKRSRETIVVGLGYALLAVARRKRAVPALAPA